MPDSPLLLHWFLPTGGDGRDPGGVTAVQGRTGSATRRPAGIGYLSQVARAAEQAGFHSLLTPVGLGCVDPWILTSALTQHTDRIGFLVAFRAGFASPTLLAQQADAFRKFAGGRLRLNVVTGGDPVEQRAYGDHLSHDRRYARTDEVMAVLRDLLDGKRVDHTGEHLTIEGAQLHDPAVEHPVPSTSAAPPRPPRTSPRAVPTYNCSGVSRPPPSPGASTGSAPWPRTALRAAPAHHQPGHRRRGVGRGRPHPRGHRPGGRPGQPGALRPHGLHRSGPDGRAARRRLRGRGEAGGRPEPLGGHRARTGRSRHGAGRLARRGGPAAARVPAPGHRRVHPLRLSAPGGGLPGGRGGRPRLRALDPA